MTRISRRSTIAQAVFEAGRNTELNFKDTYRYNIAGYRVAKLIGLTTVPMSVERTVEGKVAAVTWWVDDVQMDEKERMKTKTLGTRSGTDQQADSDHADLGRAHSEPRSQSGQHPVDP
jgi:hypothetical protein